MRRKFLVILVVTMMVVMGSLWGRSNPHGKKVFFKGMDEIEKVVVNGDEIPVYISGRLSAPSDLPVSRIALDFISRNSDLFQSMRSSLKVEPSALQILTDENGNSHVRAYQSINGIKVFGSDFYIHIKNDGSVYCVNGQIIQDANVNTTVATLSEDDAVANAIVDMGNGHLFRWENDSAIDQEKWIPKGELVVYPYNGSYRLAWNVLIGVDDENNPGNWDYYIDAITGRVLNKVNLLTDGAATGIGYTVYQGQKTIKTYSNNGIYYLKNVVQSPQFIMVYTSNNGQSLPGTPMTDNDNQWFDEREKIGVEIHYNISKVADYYKSNFNRNSYDGQGSAIVATVHYGYNYNNAYWNGSQMVFGDGDGRVLGPLGALDVTAHELTHAVTGSTANLYYYGESGALNEAVSDVFGCLIEGKNWYMGEDCYTPGVAGDAMRYINDPHRNNYPAKYSELHTGSEDNAGVHVNSTIMSHIAYLMSEGGTFSNVTINGIGRDKVGQIWYKALTQYFGRYADMHEAANDLIQAASDLYGSSSAERIATQNACAYAELVDPYNGGNGGNDGDNANDTYEPNNSFTDAYGPIESGTVYRSYISSPSDDDYYSINVGETGNIQITLANFPGDYDLYLYNENHTLIARAYTTNDPEVINFNATSAGIYYIRVDGYNETYNTTDDYELTAVFTSGGGNNDTAGDTYEPNNSFGEAYGPLENGEGYSSYILTSHDKDYYKFTIDKQGEIVVKIADFPGDYDVYLYDKNYQELAKAYTSNDPEIIHYNAESKGLYYVKVVGYDGSHSSSDDYLLTVTYPVASQSDDTPQWYYASVNWDTPHNYPNNYNDFMEFSHPNSQYVALHFSRFETEANYDVVYIKDRNEQVKHTYHGTKDAFWTVVSGGYIKAQLVSDYSVTKYGFHIDMVAYYTTPQNATESDRPFDNNIVALASDKITLSNKLPKVFALSQNTPNPFNAETAIKIAIPKKEKVTLKIYNVNGQLVRTLINKKMEPGYYNIVWNGKNDRNEPIASGIYYYKLKAKSFSDTKKMMLVK